MTKNRWLTALISVALLGALFAGSGSVAKASTHPAGLSVTAWSLPGQGSTFVGLTPWNDAPIGEPCYEGVASSIDFRWGGGPVLEGCGSEDVLVKFAGSITAPESGTYEFCGDADDGFRVDIGGTVLFAAYWFDHGDGAPACGSLEMLAGVNYPFEAWFYEYSGGAVAQLYVDGEIVDWFSAYIYQLPYIYQLRGNNLSAVAARRARVVWYRCSSPNPTSSRELPVRCRAVARGMNYRVKRADRVAGYLLIKTRVPGDGIWYSRTYSLGD